ncbi:MAG: Flp pilus assembly protein CpaB [Humidesulfovibrio sp.]|uniref:Flp pilus assembly protein CpaB n=1 Tax=Humidesulfovibrio sp. TaxID=2910988 RepID=UPI002732F85F|nr:Flp pilus assembly protein CpaB [Humidesulfovibrio sp.]MDP2847418.1 Flp pilus assembly protein CpaB [Humidesulfovibrio sp.]
MNTSLKSTAQLGLALVLALSAGILVYQWLRTAASPGQAQVQQTAQLVVAARNIPAGTRLEPAMLRTVDYPASLLPEQRYASAQELAGRMLATGVSANEPITPSRLTGEAGAGGISAVITPGKRAMAVRGNKVMGLAGFIRPGNMVDVLVTLALDENSKRNTTKVVLENIPVLATGTQMTTDKEESPSQVDIYTLELTPEESEKLALASTQGTLHFALRNASDTEIVLTDGADAKSAMASYRTRRVAQAPGGTGITVELINGAQRTKVSF